LQLATRCPISSRSDDIQFTEGIRSGSTIVRGKGGSTRRQYYDYLAGPRMSFAVEDDT
jgi:hypothetical protein